MKYPIVYKVVAYPTPFMDAKFGRKVLYFCRASRVKKFGRLFLLLHPNGEALILTKKRRGA